MRARRTVLGLAAAALMAAGAGEARAQSRPSNYSSHDAAFFSELLTDRVWVLERPNSARAGDRGTVWGIHQAADGTARACIHLDGAWQAREDRWRVVSSPRFRVLYNYQEIGTEPDPAHVKGHVPIFYDPDTGRLHSESVSSGGGALSAWFVLSLGWVQESWPQALKEACPDLDLPAGLPVNGKQTSVRMEEAVAQDPDAAVRAHPGSQLRAPGSTGLAMSAGAPTVLSPAGEGRGAAAGRTGFLAATELGPLRVPLPPSLATREVSAEETGPLPFAALTNRIATLAGVPVEVEERPARIAGGAVALPDPPAIRLTYEGRLPGLLNLVAARSGYGWSWGEGAIVFYRYRDRRAPRFVEQLAPEVAPEAPIARTARTGGGDAASSNRDASAWIVDPARHGTLRAVLEDWGADAGWSVVWTPRRDYAVRADAVFEGAFLDAVDRVLSAPATRRALVALAYEPNRHLVIEPAGGVR